MILAYHQLYDPYHCVFRMAAILNYFQRRCEIDTLRILDFFIIFQHLIPEVRWTRELRAEMKRNGLDKPHAPYVKLPGKKPLFRELSQIQNIALSHMVGRDLLYKDDFMDGFALLREKPGSQMGDKLDIFINDKLSILSFFSTIAQSMPARGTDGLKDRTGLMEFRYDAV